MQSPEPKRDARKSTGNSSLVADGFERQRCNSNLIAPLSTDSGKPRNHSNGSCGRRQSEQEDCSEPVFLPNDRAAASSGLAMRADFSTKQQTIIQSNEPSRLTNHAQLSSALALQQVTELNKESEFNRLHRISTHRSSRRVSQDETH